jgi:hypothetical protein
MSAYCSGTLVPTLCLVIGTLVPTVCPVDTRTQSFEILSSLKNGVFWVVTPCGSCTGDISRLCSMTVEATYVFPNFFVEKELEGSGDIHGMISWRSSVTTATAAEEFTTPLTRVGATVVIRIFNCARMSMPHTMQLCRKSCRTFKDSAELCLIKKGSLEFPLN